MSLFKYIDRVKSIHQLIEKENTGTSSEFAARLNISRSLLMEHLREMREAFNAPIDFCRKRQTFYYKSSFKFNILITSEMEKAKGGKNILINLVQSNSAGLYYHSFDLQSFQITVKDAADTEKRMSRIF